MKFDELENWESVPTQALWMAKYAPCMPETCLAPPALEIQQKLIGLMFLADTEDLKTCLDAGVCGKWYGILCFAAACDAILALPGAGSVPLDICEVRDALVDADCLGPRQYQFTLMDWVSFAESALSKSIDTHIAALEAFYKSEAIRLRALKAAGRI